MPPRHDYPAIAAQAIAVHRPLLALEYHPAAVAALDVFCDQTWGDAGAAPQDDHWRPSDGSWKAVVGLGAFFGELMRRQFRGEWREDEAQPDNILAASIVMPGGQKVFAMSKVYRRLRDGASDRLEPLYLLVRQQLGAQPSPLEVEGWVRQAQHFEGARRPDLAARFYERALALVPAGGQRAALERLRSASLASSVKTDAQARQGAGDDAQSRLHELAQSGAATLAAFGVRTEHGALTLFGLDTYVDESFGPGPVPDEKRRSLDLQLGAFVGELLCRRYRGSWRAQPEPALARSQVAWPSGAATVPFEMVARRMATGGPRVLEQVSALLKPLCQAGEAEDPPEDPRDWFRQADEYAHKVHRLDLAVRVATVGLRIAGGDSPSARLRVAGWCRSLGHYEAAQQHVEAGLRLEPAHVGLALEQARLALDRGDAPAAEAAAARLVERRPETVEGQLVKAAALVAQGRTEEGLAAFDRALELDPTSAPALLGRARALLSLERPTESRDWLADFAGRSDCEPERSYLAALAADSADDPVDAHELFLRSQQQARLAADQREHATLRARALASDPRVRIAEIGRIQDLGAVVSAYAALNADHPSLVEPWRERGVGLSMLGRAAEAIECFRHAAALAPGEPSSYDHEAVTLGRLERFAEAIAALDRGLLACPASGVLLSRKAVFLTLAGQPEEALRVCDAAIAADPGYPDSWAFKGDIEQRLGRPGEAISSLERYLSACRGSREKRAQVVRRQLWSLRNPGKELETERARESQTRALERLRAGALPEALAFLDKAVAADPLFAEAWINRGSCLYDLSRFEEATSSFAQADELRGDTVLVADVVAECLLRLRRSEDAVATFDRALVRLPQDPATLRGKARLLVRLGRPAEALPIYQRLVARSPEDASLARERATALEKANRAVEALAAYQALLSSTPGDPVLRAARDAALRQLGRGAEVSAT